MSSIIGAGAPRATSNWPKELSPNMCERFKLIMDDDAFLSAMAKFHSQCNLNATPIQVLKNAVNIAAIRSFMEEIGV